MEHFPREVILDILSRLPVTSLLQCKLVCKAWKHLLQDPHLVTMHFSRSCENDPSLILHCDNPTRNQLYSLELSTLDEDCQMVNKIRVPSLPEFHVVGSSKGSLCLCDSLTKNSIYIYNPFSGDYIKLPKSMTFSNQDVVLGFGFHPGTKEYKVVMICYYMIPCGFDLPGEFIPPESQVQIFTLGSPTWRRVGKIPYYPLQGPSEVLVNGRLHWDTRPLVYSRGCLLISFDLAKEQFQVVPKPDSVDLDKYKVSLVVLRGCLSAVVGRNYGPWEIWVMKEYDVKESWTKEFRIGIHVPRGLEQDVPQPLRTSKFYHKRSVLRVLCLLKNGVFLLEYKGKALVSFDPTTGTFKDLFFEGMPNRFQAIVHEGNLALIDM